MDTPVCAVCTTNPVYHQRMDAPFVHPQEWQRVQTMVTQMDTSAGDVLPWTADTADSVPQEEGAAQQGADTRWSDLTLVKVEDASLLESPATQLIAQQVSLVDMAYAHARRQLMTLQELQASTGSEEVEEGG